MDRKIKVTKPSPLGKETDSLFAYYKNPDNVRSAEIRMLYLLAVKYPEKAAEIVTNLRKNSV